MSTDTPESRISDFFTDPAVNPPTLGPASVLHLLRRDVNFCFGIDHKTGQPAPRLGRAIFPGVMTIMAGWDLLGKFLAGSDAPNQAGPRFQEFVQRFVRTATTATGDLTEEQVWCLWQLRNSMLHSFGLIAKAETKRYPVDIVQFVLSYGAMDVIFVGQTPGTGARLWTAVVDYWKLQQQFEQSIAAFRLELEDTGSGGELQIRFQRIWADYGRTQIQP
jgi:hypothetical protein